jgi:CRISPR/Cas system CMR-associated protein Cmr5 small subunit
MTIKNLEQIRARNALVAAKDPYRGDNEGEVVKKIPAMIRGNGFLAAAAFALQKGGDYERVFAGIVNHLAGKEAAKLMQPGSVEDLVRWLSTYGKATAARLREVTQEAMAYLAYLRRFARKGDQT